MRRSGAIFIVLGVVVAVALYVCGPAPLYAALQTHGVRVPGVIISVECAKSTHFAYSFSAEGRTYTGVGTSIEQCAHFKKGASVPVVYLDTDPERNFSGDPAQAFKSYLVASGLASILASGVAVIGFHIWKGTHG